MDFCRGIPVGMVAEATSFAAFHQVLVNGGRIGHRQLIPRQLIQHCTSRQVSGWNKPLKTFLSVGRGFMPGADTVIVLVVGNDRLLWPPRNVFFIGLW